MSNKDFLLQRISIFAKSEIDPNNDDEVVSMLQRRFNVYLPQRPNLNDALEAAVSDHEIIDLILKYRTS